MFTSLQSFKAYACFYPLRVRLLQDAWTRSECVTLGPAWVSVRGGGASWRRTARSAATCATVRHWRHPPPTSPAALASLPHSILHCTCGRTSSISWNSSDIIDSHTGSADSLTCSFAPQSLWMQCLHRHLLLKMWRSKLCLVEKLWASAVGQKIPECLQKSGRASLNL